MLVLQIDCIDLLIYVGGIVKQVKIELNIRHIKETLIIIIINFTLLKRRIKVIFAVYKYRKLIQ